MASIIAISISKKKGEKKSNVREGRFIAGFGLEGDAHGGSWHRQISLLGLSSIEAMQAKGAAVKPGDFAENVTVDGMALHLLPVGTRLALGEDVVLRVTQIGKECHQGCAIMEQVGQCIMPTEGIFAIVDVGGIVTVGDSCEVLSYPEDDSVVSVGKTDYL